MLLKKIQIRQAVMADLPGLLRLEKQGFNSDRISARSFRRWLRNGHEGLAVACDSEQVFGYVLILHRRGSAVVRLYSLAVDKAASGQGIGRALLRWAENKARDWSAQRIHLEVQHDNQFALQLYRSAGYELVKRLPGYYENGADGLRLRREL